MKILKRRDVQDGLAMLLLGAALLVHCLVKAGQMRQKTAFFMSPYFFPVILSGCGILLGALLAGAGLRSGAEEAPRGRLRAADLLAALALTVAYRALLPVLGFMPATVLFLAGMTAWLGERRLPVLIPVAVLTPLVLYLVFRTGLGVRLP